MKHRTESAQRFSGKSDAIEKIQDTKQLDLNERLADGRVKPAMTNGVYCANVLQASIWPDFSPVSNHCTRCAAVPCVKESGTA